MQVKGNIDHPKAGFTLLEIIITITVSAILSVVLFQFFSGHNGRSYSAILNLDRNLALQSAMDQITSDYRRLLLTATQPLVSLQNNISSGNYWTDGEIAVTESYCLSFSETSPGVWAEVKTADSCTHPSDTVLKVTLSLGEHTLTGLFAR